MATSKPQTNQQYLQKLQKVSHLPVWIWGVVLGLGLLAIAIFIISGGIENINLDFSRGKDRSLGLSKEFLQLSGQNGKFSFQDRPEATLAAQAVAQGEGGYLQATGKKDQKKTIMQKLSDLLSWSKKSSPTGGQSDRLNGASDVSGSETNKSENSVKSVGTEDSGWSSLTKDIPIIGDKIFSNNNEYLQPEIIKSKSQNGLVLFTGFGKVVSANNRSVRVSMGDQVDQDLEIGFSDIPNIQIYKDSKWQRYFATDVLKSGDVIWFRWWGDDMDINSKDLSVLLNDITGGTWKLNAVDVIHADVFNQFWKG